MFLVNSRYRHLSATLFSFNSSIIKSNVFTYQGYPFSRSYGVILPSSLTRVLSSASGYSPCLPVSVCGTITCCLNRGFSWQHGCSHFMGQSPSSSLLGPKEERICLLLQPTSLNRLFHQTDDLPSCVPPSLKQQLGGTGILTCFPSTTPFGLALGID